MREEGKIKEGIEIKINNNIRRIKRIREKKKRKENSIKTKENKGT